MSNSRLNELKQQLKAAQMFGDSRTIESLKKLIKKEEKKSTGSGPIPFG